MSEVWRLYQLQKADSRIAEVTGNLTTLRADDVHQVALAGAEGALQNATDEVQRLKKELHDLEMEDKTVRARIASLQEKLYGGRISNPKELAGYETELENVRARASNLEDDMLNRMEDLEGRETSLEGLRQEAEAHRASRDERQGELEKEIARLEVELSHARSRRERLASESTPADLRLYENLRAKKNGVAVVRVAASSCEGCRMHLTEHKIREAKGPTMTCCSTCGRILYVES